MRSWLKALVTLLYFGFVWVVFWSNRTLPVNYIASSLDAVSVAPAIDELSLPPLCTVIDYFVRDSVIMI